MANIWLTYAWVDNDDGDVDYVAQELETFGVAVHLDRWDLNAGQRLWDQIGSKISDSSVTQAWVFYATASSLQSEACREELAYALDRALSARGEFPIIALFPGPIDSGLIPPSIRVRLYISLTDDVWKERIKAAAEGRAADITRPLLKPYSLTVHPPKTEGGMYQIEVRPRAGTWVPFVAAVPMDEKEVLEPSIHHGPKGGQLVASMMMVPVPGEMASSDGKWWMMRANNQATPTESYYLQCRRIPSVILFGPFKAGQMQLFQHSFTK